MFRPGQRVGLLGGSFNPAHAGHVHISTEARKRLRLDQVTWLVSPQNPLKSSDGMADYDTRFSIAQQLTDSTPHITVSDLEKQHGLFYSRHTIRFLVEQFPRTHFVWLMGADNWECFHKWREWQTIARLMPIAICDRAPFSHRALHAKAATRFRERRISERNAPALLSAPLPAWSYLFMPRHPLSATKLRKTLGEKAYSVV